MTYFVHNTLYIYLLFFENYISSTTTTQSCIFPLPPPGISIPHPPSPTQDLKLSPPPFPPLLDYILLHQQITTSKISHDKFIAIKQYLYKHLNTSLIR